MSKKEIICPNCGQPASGNYCQECGQPTHLHKDSFMGLVMHFISHYFHFDSKFWVTLKTLVFKPGKLAVAYRNKQRMRYIQPISLYIFVSVAFFLLFAFAVKFEQTSSVGANDMTIVHKYSFGYQGRIKTETKDKWLVDYNCDSLREVKAMLKEMNDKRKDYFKQPYNKFRMEYVYLFSTFYIYYIYPYAYRHQMYDIDLPVNLVYNKFIQTVPKIFFILMPVLALLLYAVFFNRRGYTFTDYAVMSLHTHVFLFISATFLILVVGSVTDASKPFWLFLFFVLVPWLHFLIASRNFFGRSWMYTIAAGTLTWVFYLGLVLLVSIATVLMIINNT